MTEDAEDDSSGMYHSGPAAKNAAGCSARWIRVRWESASQNNVPGTGA
jgi:hypothetical protein